MRGRTTVYVVCTAALLTYVGALGVLGAEQDATGSTIRSFGDALWWAVVTVTTVGYGDYTPITVVGRLVAVALMLTGIGVIGTVAATVSSWFVQQVQAPAPAQNPQSPPVQSPVADGPSSAEVRELVEQVRALTARLTAAEGAAGPEHRPNSAG